MIVLRRKFVGELARVCAPDGTVLVVTWCCREGQLEADELALLDRICEAYYLPAWISIAEYKELFGEWGRFSIYTHTSPMILE
jgi:tocopherol O-methyltransferase